MVDNAHKQIAWDSIVCLIVDDDKFSRTFIKTALSQIGIKNAKEAGNINEALEALHNYKVNVILLDQQIANGTGLEFAQSLKNNEYDNIAPVPVIMITIDTQEKTVLTAKSLGIHEYLVKPISPLALKKRICTAIGIKQ